MNPDHICTKHEPGTAACYSRHGCRCTPCRTVCNRAKKRNRNNIDCLVDAEPIRRHVKTLMAIGVTQSAIANNAQVSQSHITYLLGTMKRCHPDVARRILSVTGKTPGRSMVDATGTRRRLQALMVIGWPLSWLSARLGKSDASAHHWLCREQVLGTTATLVESLYDELWNTPPVPVSQGQRMAVSRTLHLAKRNRWHPAAAWDDDRGAHGIDNPAAKPHTPGSLRLADRHALTLADAERLIGTEAASRIARRFGYSKADSFARWLRRQGRDDLANQIKRKAA